LTGDNAFCIRRHCGREARNFMKVAGEKERNFEGSKEEIPQLQARFPNCRI
jgi:hypothetical protein